MHVVPTDSALTEQRAQTVLLQRAQHQGEAVRAVGNMREVIDMPIAWAVVKQRGSPGAVRLVRVEGTVPHMSQFPESFGWHRLTGPVMLTTVL